MVVGDGGEVLLSATPQTQSFLGRMAERFIAAVLKTVDRKIRGFESLSLRLSVCVRGGGAGVDDRGRLLSGCRGNSLPRVRIPASPL